MTAKLYYFSGTGNSLAVARDIAGKIGGSLVSIPSMMDSGGVTSDADVVGLVFPVYHKSVPAIIRRFIGKMRGLEEKYIFAVCTYGDTPGLAIRDLRRLVQSRGGQLAAGFGVHMPFNYLTPSFELRRLLSSFTLREVPFEEQQALFAAARRRTESIAAFVNARQSGTFETTSDVLTRLADHFNLPDTLGKWVWLRVAGVDEPPESSSFFESIRLMDRGFEIDEECNGCGVCSRVCPVGNIRMVDGRLGLRPVWQHNCEQCFACLHWCPQEAIQFGKKTVGKKRYRHRDVKLADMLRHASRG